MHGSTAGETIVANDTTVDVGTSQRVTFATVEALELLGHEGTDTFEVTAGAIPMFIDGGDPIGAGDVLTLTGDIDAAMFTPGPENDEGLFVITTGTTTHEEVSFDRIETINVTDTDPVAGDMDVTVMGTGGGDQITAVGQGTNVVDVQVNAGPIVTYTGLDTLDLLGKNGDDEIDVDVNGLTVVAITVDGGLASASGDEVTITGVGGATADGANYTPDAVDSGTFATTGLATAIDLDNIERLIYDGENEGETLTITSAAGGTGTIARTFTHTPGAQVDNGTVQVGNWLAIRYTTLGAAGSIDLEDGDADPGDDSLVYLGTSGDDVFTITTAGLVQLAGHVNVDASDLDDVTLETLDGNDWVSVDPSDLFAGGLRIEGGSSDASSDTLQVDADGTEAVVLDFNDATSVPAGATTIDGIIGGSTGKITITGTEDVRVDGADDVANNFDVLNYGAATGVLRVTLDGDDADNMNDADQIDVSLTGGGDVVTYEPLSLTSGSLTGAGPDVSIVGFNNVSSATSGLTIDGGGNVDQLIVLGSTADDTVSIEDGDTTTTLVSVTVGGNLWVPVNFGANLESLRVETGDGDDGVSITNLAPSIEIDGGAPVANSDTITVTVPDSAFLTQGAVSTSGTLVDSLTAETYEVDWSAIEVLTINTGDAGDDGATLTIRATDDEDTIAVAPITTGAVAGDGAAWINDGTVLRFNTAAVTDAAFTALDVQGRFGADAISVTPIDMLPMTVQGMSPSDEPGDDVSVNISAATTVTPAATGATVDMTGAGLVTVETSESLTIVGDSGDDDLTITTPDAVDSTIEVTPGSVGDAGLVQVDSLLAVGFEQLGLGATLLIADGTDTTETTDTLVINATNSADRVSNVLDTSGATDVGTDVIDVKSDSGAVDHIDVDPTRIEALTINLLGGDDRATINAADGLYSGGVRIEGAAADSDWVNITGREDAVDAIDLTVGANADSLTGVVAGTLWLSGIEDLSIDGNGATTDDGDTFSVTDLGLAGSDLETVSLQLNGIVPPTNGAESITIQAANQVNTIEVTPVSATSGTVSANGNGPLVSFTDLGTTATDATLTIIGGSESDTLRVHGSTAGQRIVAVVGDGTSGGTVTVDADDSATTTNDWQVVTFNSGAANIEALELLGHEGGDAFAVTPGSVPVFVDGNDPIGSTSGDSLTVNVTAAVTFQAGPEGDEGRVDETGSQSVNFDHVEAVTIDGDGGDGATVNATNADNDITVVGTGTATDEFTVSIDGAPAVQYTDFTSLVVNSLAGDDDIDIDVNSLSLTGGITVNGNDPSASGDTLTVTGRTTTTTATWTPTSAEDGTLDIGGQVINVRTVERLVYDGENKTDSLVVMLPTSSNNDVATIDFSGPGAGQVDVTAVTAVTAARVEAWLPVVFTNFAIDSTAEQIQITDMGGATDTGDTVKVIGSDSADLFDVDNAGVIELTKALQEQLRIGTDGVERLTLDALDGDDRSNIVVLPSPYQDITLLGGGPANDDYVKAILEAVTDAHFGTIIPLPTGADTASDLEIRDAADALLATLRLVSLEAIEVETADAADTITVQGTSADEAWKLEQGETGARLLLEALTGSPIILPPVEFSGFGQANFVDDGGTNVFTIAPTNLDAATLFNVDGDGNDTLEIVGTDNPDTIAQTASNEFTVETREVQWVAGSVDTVRLLGGAAADTFDVDLSILDGGVSRVILGGDDPMSGDRLDVVVSTGATVSQGATSTSGIVSATKTGPITQTIDFANLERINIDSVTDDSTVTINATDDNDTIEVARTANTNEGRVWINDGTVITLNVGGGDNNFGGAGGVVINGKFGVDDFTATPIAGVPVIFNGGAPSDDDSATINASNDVEVAGLLTDSAITTVTGFASVTVNSTSSLSVRADAADRTLTVTTPNGGQDISLTPGATVDSGDVQVDSLIPIAFSNLGAAGELQLGDQADQQDDTLTYHGTQSRDTFSLAATTGAISLNSQVVVTTPGVLNVTLAGHDDNDHFTVNAPQPYDNVTLSGGDSSDNGDSATLNATTDTTVTLGGNVATFVGGNLSGVSLSTPGVDDVSLNAGTNAITIDGTADDDHFVVTPVGADTATIQVNGHAPVVTTNNSGLLDITAAGGGQNTLDVVLSAASETVTVNSNFVQTIRGALTEQVDYTPANIHSLRVFAGEGTDEVSVTVDAVTPSIFVNGGDPIGPGISGDTLNVIATTAVAIQLGPEVDEGSFTAATSAPVSYDKIENPTLTTPSGATISGTNSDDAIAVVARDETTHAAQGADGEQDFTVAMSDGRDILFIDTPSLTLDTLAGDDRVSVIMPAPEQREWDVDVTINGGVGSDTLTLDTPGSNGETVDYTPMAIDKGVIKITQGDVATQSQITLGSTSASPGGTETFVYNGNGDNDTINVIGNGVVGGTPDVFVRTLGDVADEGSVRLNNFLPIDYENVGLNATLNLDGVAGSEDRLIQFGTSRDNDFRVAAGGVGNVVEIDGFIPVSTTATELLTLIGEGGDDSFRIETTTDFLAIDIEATDPGTDEVAIIGTDGVDEAFTVSHGSLGAGNINKSIAANLDVNYTGVELVSVTGDGVEDTLTVDGTPANDSLLLAAGPTGDRVTGDSQIPVEARGTFDTLTVDINSDSGNDTLTVDVTRLQHAGTFVVNANPNEVDRLVLLGTNARDRVSSTATTVTIAEGANENTVQFTEGELNLITIQTLDGNDNIVLADFAEPKQIEAGNGHDYVDISQSIDGIVFGGDGDDVLRGGPEADFLDGGRGNDWLFGLGAVDTLLGGDGNDFLVGGTGNDNMNGGDGSDTFIWNPGDNNDQIEGGADDVDVLQFVGGNVPDDFTMSADGNRLRFERQSGDVVIDAADIEQIDANVTISFARDLSGDQEVAPVATTASGSVQMVYNSAANTFDLDVYVEGIARADLTAAHIHQAAVGVNGDVILGLGDGTSWTSENGGLRRMLRGVELPPANIADLLAGNLYVNVHTTAHAGGELRGQLSLVGNTANLTGGDSFIVNDLAPAGVEVVNLGLGVNDAAEVDDVTISGRSTADTISVTGDSEINVAGLAYDINISHAVAGEDQLTINTGGGDDTVDVAEFVAGSFAVNDLIVDGGLGNDTISGFGDLRGAEGDDLLTGGDIGQIIRGGAGNDTILGGGGDDDLRGGDGEDLFVGGAGLDTIDGTGGFDTILIGGTSGNDVINVSQTLDTELVHTVNGDAQTDTISGIEEARVDAGDGDDLIRTTINDGLFDDAGKGVQMTVWGGGSRGLGDRLIIVDDGEDDLTILRNGFSNLDGTVTIGPANAEPFEHEFTSIERLQIVDENGAPINADGDAARLVVFKHDEFESNDDRFTATLIGANEAINIDPSIDPAGQVNPFGDGFDVPGDEDWYRIEALSTGTLDVQVFFEEIGANAGDRIKLPGLGSLDIAIFDVDGTNITASGLFGQNDGANELDVDGDAHAEDERLRIPAVEGQTYYLQVVGTTVDAINNYSITVINQAPPTPFDLELQDTPPVDGQNSDSGQSQTDNLTRDTTPTIYLRLDDGTFRYDSPGNDATTTPVDQVIPVPFQANAGSAGYRIAIFDEGPTPSQSAEAPQTPVGFAEETTTDGLYRFTFPTALTDGSHFITARVQMTDPADPQQTGFGDRSQSMQIVVDAVAPPVAFGDPFELNDGLDPSDGDTGVQGVEVSFHDRITSDTTPSFFGVAEADSIVRVYVDQNGDGAVDAADTLLGTTTATPAGTSQDPNAQWNLTSTVDLNDPNFFATADGVRRLLVTAEDQAGTVSAPDNLIIFVDTHGPQVTAFDFNSQGSSFNEFDPDPMDGPTPAVNSLVLSIEDLAARSNVDATFLYDAFDSGLAHTTGHYSLVGDHSGEIAIVSIAFAPDAAADGSTATGTITLTFAEPLPDDRFTLTISDAIQDPAGNALDGESNATEPQGAPTFSSGDGVPGTSFTARFTVDSRPEIATATAGGVQIDVNSNGVFDPDNSDATNRDFIYQIGTDVDEYFAGNFNTAVMVMDATGFDKIGVYGQAAGTGTLNPQFRFLLDFDHDGAPDFTSVPASEFQVPGKPVAGDFSATHSGDEIGLLAFSSQLGAPLPNSLRPTRSYDARWILDTNGNNLLDVTDTVIPIDLSSYPEIQALVLERQVFPANVTSPPTEVDLASHFLPIVGDFNGDGNDDLAILDAVNDRWSFDLDRDGRRDDTFDFGIPGDTERPVANDINLDGIDDFGVYSFVPTPTPADPSEPLPTQPAQPADFRFLISDRPGAAPSAIFNAFAPTPLGNDESFEFGDKTELPVFGNFDPPTARTSGGRDLPASHNEANPLDVNNDGLVTPIDALVVINALNQYGSGDVTVFAEDEAYADSYLDVTDDGIVSPLDGLRVINFLNSDDAAPQPEGEALFEVVVEEPEDDSDRDAKASVFGSVREWALGATKRVASLLQPEVRPTRSLPDKLDLPPEVYDVVPRSTEEVLDEIAADRQTREDREDRGDLNDAVDEIFTDWLD